MSYVDEVIGRVVKENPNEPEFHQAVKEVLDSLRPVVDANEPEFRRDALLERLVNPERQISSVCRGSMITVRFTSIPDTAFSSTVQSVRIGAVSDFIPPLTLVLSSSSVSSTSSRIH